MTKLQTPLHQANSGHNHQEQDPSSVAQTACLYVAAPQPYLKTFQLA